jgi:hypothetical protein
LYIIFFKKVRSTELKNKNIYKIKKNDRYEQLLDLARKQDAAKSEDENANKNNNLEN